MFFFWFALDLGGWSGSPRALFASVESSQSIFGPEYCVSKASWYPRWKYEKNRKNEKIVFFMIFWLFKAQGEIDPGSQTNDFRWIFNENALSRCSDGVRECSWACFRVIRVLQVDWSGNKTIQAMLDRPISSAPFFFAIWNETMHIEIDLMRSPDLTSELEGLCLLSDWWPPTRQGRSGRSTRY